MSGKNKVNSYVCQKCGGHTVTVDVDPGVTPFMLNCRVNLDCGGVSLSSFYTCPQDLVPEWEWYRPTEAETMAAVAGKPDYIRQVVREHRSLGGLEIRRRQTGTKGE